MSETKLHFNIDLDDLTFGDLVAFETGKMVKMRTALVKSMTDAKGNPLPEEQAAAQLDAMPLSQLKATFEAFGEAIKTAQQGELPND